MRENAGYLLLNHGPTVRNKEKHKRGRARPPLHEVGWWLVRLLSAGHTCLSHKAWSSGHPCTKTITGPSSLPSTKALKPGFSEVMEL